MSYISKLLNKRIVILLLSIVPLLVVYSSELFFEVKACRLCLYQRIPYFIIVITILLTFSPFFKNISFKIINLILEISLIIGFSIAIFHYGVEKKIFKFNSKCTNNLSNAENFEDYKKMLVNQDYVLCDQVSYEFLGISMSLWNAIYTLFFFIIIIKYSNNLPNKNENK
ncbi:disulfide bond formation protein B [Rickettsiales endosymbiont of Trichoplax sp. H2]|uniref:disulfide bond formation protein B n=1 Tax=Rickettsiales endosymbiont of Trichoplax sp. H2 TaxID=2021221 RepID=UPI0012B21EA2|nr:disulfide bond formation protein B [Rickettsiales endosymbiont of Trichoplax sp. H2]MSO14262.1 Disulfide bond formation protein B [Rickettsiales endosymbiont of Trichoplax sp. H2]